MASTFQYSEYCTHTRQKFCLSSKFRLKIDRFAWRAKTLFVCDIKDEISIKKSEVYECYIQANSKPICITTT